MYCILKVCTLRSEFHFLCASMSKDGHLDPPGICDQTGPTSAISNTRPHASARKSPTTDQHDMVEGCSVILIDYCTAVCIGFVREQILGFSH